MNRSAICHEIEGCPGLYVDAFCGHYLRKTEDENNAYILTHYHGDHYGSLQRDGKYKGPALIHCTPVTASLLRSVHNVPSSYVVEHNYGETWTYRINDKKTNNNNNSNTQSNIHDNANEINCSRNKYFSSNSDNAIKDDIKSHGKSMKDDEVFLAPVVSSSHPGDTEHTIQSVVKITFYDANHCPGAAIALIQFSDGISHLHTGDMRFHTKMKEYPLLKDVIKNRKLDLVYLDTTYGHPKHNFMPQEEAINTITARVEDELSLFPKHDDGDSNAPVIQPRRTCIKTLILLSCYSIGKEKVLWDISMRTDQLIYVTEKKLKMLKCVQDYANIDVSSRIVQRCTTDPNETDIHCIPMGVAGEVWPFFRPSFQKCVDYEEKLTKQYDKIVAFIPTGWANASNWNKKNAIREKRMESHQKKSYTNNDHDPGNISTTEVVQKKQQRFIDVKVQLISYSEHSAYPELESFVEYLHPRKIIPTVFSDSNEYRKIESRFRHLVDNTRAKKAFFKSMNKSSQEKKTKSSNLDSNNMRFKEDEDVNLNNKNNLPQKIAMKAKGEDKFNTNYTDDYIRQIEQVFKEKAISPAGKDGGVGVVFPSIIIKKTLCKRKEIYGEKGVFNSNSKNETRKPQSSEKLDTSAIVIDLTTSDEGYHDPLCKDKFLYANDILKGGGNCTDAFKTSLHKNATIMTTMVASPNNNKNLKKKYSRATPVPKKRRKSSVPKISTPQITSFFALKKK